PAQHRRRHPGEGRRLRRLRRHARLRLVARPWAHRGDPERRLGPRPRLRPPLHLRGGPGAVMGPLAPGPDVLQPWDDEPEEDDGGWAARNTSLANISCDLPICACSWAVTFPSLAALTTCLPRPTASWPSALASVVLICPERAASL